MSDHNEKDARDKRVAQKRWWAAQDKRLIMDAAKILYSLGGSEKQ